MWLEANTGGSGGGGTVGASEFYYTTLINHQVGYTTTKAYSIIIATVVSSGSTDFSTAIQVNGAISTELYHDSSSSLSVAVFRNVPTGAQIKPEWSSGTSFRTQLVMFE